MMEKAMAPHSSTLAWKIPWIEEPGRLLLQRIFPAQGSNSGLLHFRQILYHLSHQEIPNNNNQIRSDQISRSIVSDSLQPHRWQLTRFPRPWDPPGKNTGVGCHFLLQRMKVKSESEVAQSSDPQRPHGLQPSRLLNPWDFPGKSTGVGCHCLLHY